MAKMSVFSWLIVAVLLRAVMVMAVPVGEGYYIHKGLEPIVHIEYPQPDIGPRRLPPDYLDDLRIPFDLIPLAKEGYMQREYEKLWDDTLSKLSTDPHNPPSETAVSDAMAEMKEAFTESLMNIRLSWLSRDKDLAWKIQQRKNKIKKSKMKACVDRIAAEECNAKAEAEADAEAREELRVQACKLGISADDCDLEAEEATKDIQGMKDDLRNIRRKPYLQIAVEPDEEAAPPDIQPFNFLPDGAVQNANGLLQSGAQGVSMVAGTAAAGAAGLYGYLSPQAAPN